MTRILYRERRSTPCLSSSLQWSRTGKFASACVPLFNVLTAGSSNAKFQHELFIMDPMNFKLSGDLRLRRQKLEISVPQDLDRIQHVLEQNKLAAERYRSPNSVSLGDIISNKNPKKQSKLLEKFCKAYGTSHAHESMELLMEGDLETINQILRSKRVRRQFASTHRDAAFRVVETLKKNCEKNCKEIRLIKKDMQMATSILHKLYTVDPSMFRYNRLIGEIPMNGPVANNKVQRTQSFRVAALEILEYLKKIAEENGAGCGDNLQFTLGTNPTVSEGIAKNKIKLRQLPRMIRNSMRSIYEKQTPSNLSEFEKFERLLNCWTSK